MASRWSSNGSSGAASLSYTSVAIVAIATLVVGGIGGYLAGNNSSSVTTQAALSPIATPSVDGMQTAEPNEAGAVKAATSLIVGIPNLAGEPDLSREPKITALISDTAGPQVKETLDLTVSTLRGALYGGSTTSRGGRVVVNPSSYRSQLNADQTVTVTIWYSMVFADPVQSAFRAAWYTSTVQLVLQDGWKIQNLTQANGPTPQVLSSQAGPSTLEAAQPVLSNAYGYRYALAP